MPDLSTQIVNSPFANFHLVNFHSNNIYGIHCLHSHKILFEKLHYKCGCNANSVTKNHHYSTAFHGYKSISMGMYTDAFMSKCQILSRQISYFRREQSLCRLGLVESGAGPIRLHVASHFTHHYMSDSKTRQCTLDFDGFVFEDASNKHSYEDI